MRLFFSQFSLAQGYSVAPARYEDVDYGECDLTAREGYTRELVNPNTIIEKQIVEQSNQGISVGGETVIPCGIKSELVEHSAQEIVNNNLMKGDYVVIKDGQGTVLDMFTFNSFRQQEFDQWTPIYRNVDTLTIELYADQEENAYGINISSFARGYTEEEKQLHN